jgi:hypothetical protein
MIPITYEQGLNELRLWSDAAYAKIQELDRLYSDEFAIPPSIKTTSIKPSGTVSLLAGGLFLPIRKRGLKYIATSGMHFPESRFIIRRVRIPSDSDLLPPLKAAGYEMEVDQGRSLYLLFSHSHY